jgi:hypothetical protein
MAISVKEIELWRIEVQNKPGVLAGVLAPMAEAGADLHVVMGYRYPGRETKAAIEVFPVKSKKQAAAAEAAGLKPSSIPTLLIEGDNKPGLGHSIAQALADGGINMGFLIAQVIKGRYSAVLGFETADDAKNAAPLIKKAVAAKRK